ncbi:hypothetical protein [Ancylobacter sp.]|uniref:hypothetical protein n=1 Tax=Ancylobacter sp. TaxID=1872567 RepID=UPI003BA96D6D
MKKASDSKIAELGEIYGNLVERLNEEPLTWPDFPRGSFKESAWDTFDPVQAASILLSERESFAGHKRVLFSAYCAWSVSPMYRKTIRTAISLAIIDHIAAAETMAQKMYGDVGLLADMAARFNHLGHHFLYEIYFPIGGIRAASQTSSRTTLKKWLNEHRIEIKYLCIILNMRRFGNEFMKDKSRFIKVSNHNSMKYAQLMTNELPDFGSSKMYEAWKKRKSSIAIPYAASYVTLPDGSSLLDVILGGRISYSKHSKYFQEWMAKAISASVDVIGRIVDAEVGAANLSQLPKVKGSPLGEIPFTPQQQNYLIQKYSVSCGHSRRRGQI